MNNEVATRPTGLAINDGPTVLGERQARLPVGGKIRPGIKVLTRDAKEAKDDKGIHHAQSLYDKLAKEGFGWDEIEKQVKAKIGFTKSPLTPKNVPYFTVFRHDFSIPEVADKIMELYGSDGPDGFRLYRFPVIFPVDFWQTLLPHRLRVYTANELVYWSEYAADGTRYCKMHAPVEMIGDDKNKRAKRPFGGRSIILRPENDGICNPNNCPEYQVRKCTLSGAYLFYIPGIPGTSAIELPTTSIYSLMQARQKMEMIAFMRGGKISGTVAGKPMFFISKKLQEVSQIDPATGKPKRVKQWLIELESTLDMTAFFAANEPQQALEAGQDAARVIEHGDAEFDEPGRESETPGTGTAEVTVPPPPPPAVVEDKADEPITTRVLVKKMRREIDDLLIELGIAPGPFSVLMLDELGDGWGKDANKLPQAKEFLVMLKNDPALIAELFPKVAQ